MKNLIRNFLLLQLFAIPFISNSQEDASVNIEYDAIGDAMVTAYNHTKNPLYIILDFSFLRNASFAGDLPHIEKVEPGITQLFTIGREIDQPPPELGIELKWRIAHPNPDLSKPYPYLLPVKENSKIKVSRMSEIGQFSNSKLSSYGVALKMQNSNQVHAARAGSVIRKFEGYDPKSNFSNPELPSRNFLMVLHEDGTIGEYINFAYNGILVEQGSEIIAGQPIGKVSSENQLLGFALFHSDLHSKNNKYFIPEFFVGKEKPSQVAPGEEYTVEHPVELITKEMKRKEKKAYLKSK